MVLEFQISELGRSVGGCRNLFSQVLAAMTSNLSIMALEGAMNFSTISVPDLLNSSEGLSLTEAEASWFSSFVFVFQPIGALLSIPMLDYCGRKNSNILSNIPHLVAWVLMYFAWNRPSLYIANGLLGLGIGLMETPIATYMGELSDSSLRGSLIMFNQVFGGVGILFIYFLGSVCHWREAALISLLVPLSSMICAFLAPDSPIWLLSRGKEKEATRALRFLRGWTAEENVKEEFKEMKLYLKALPSCVLCVKPDGSQSSDTCEHAQMGILRRNILKLKYIIFCKQTLRPLTFIVLFFLFYVTNGILSTRPYLVNICSALGMPGDPKHIVVIVGVIIFITCIIQTGLIKKLGKRKTVILSLLAATVGNAGLSIYAKMNIGKTVISFNTETFPQETNYAPLLLLYLLAISYGLFIPWVMIGEVFPFRGRALAQGVTVTIVYIMEFIGTKTYYDLEMSIGLWGTFGVYAGFSLVGTVYLYLFTPETEGKTLQEIEDYYNGDFRIFADDPVINCLRKRK